MAGFHTGPFIGCFCSCAFFQDGFIKNTTTQFRKRARFLRFVPLHSDTIYTNGSMEDFLLFCRQHELPFSKFAGSPLPILLQSQEMVLDRSVCIQNGYWQEPRSFHSGDICVLGRRITISHRTHTVDCMVSIQNAQPASHTALLLAGQYRCSTGSHGTVCSTSSEIPNHHGCTSQSARHFRDESGTNKPFHRQPELGAGESTERRQFRNRFGRHPIVATCSFSSIPVGTVRDV